MLKTLIAAAGLAGTLGVALPARGDWYSPTPIAHRWDRDDGWHRRDEWRRHEEWERYRRWRHFEHERHEHRWGW